VHGHSGALEGSQIRGVLTDGKRVAVMHVKENGSEVVDGLEHGLLVKKPQGAPQEAPEVQPSKISDSARGGAECFSGWTPRRVRALQREPENGKVWPRPDPIRNVGK
jgi:hypothetical protein